MRSQIDNRLKRRANILYRLRKKGVRCDTKEKTIYFAFNKDPYKVIQIKRLCNEYNFQVQLIIE